MIISSGDTVHIGRDAYAKVRHVAPNPIDSSLGLVVQHFRFHDRHLQHVLLQHRFANANHQVPPAHNTRLVHFANNYLPNEIVRSPIGFQSGLWAIQFIRISFFGRPLLIVELKRAKRLYTYLCRASEALNSAFSLILFLLIATILIWLSFFLYMTIMTCQISIPVLKENLSLLLCQFFLSFLALGLILATADTPVQQVRNRSIEKKTCTSGTCFLR